MFCFFSGTSFAQEKCIVKGNVTIDGGTLDNVKITLYKDSQQESVRNVPKNGKFSYDLDFGYDYIFEFSKKEFVTKKVSVSTYVPADVLERDSRFPPCKFSIKLFRLFSGIDLSVFDQPIGMIMYNNETDLIETDLSYLTEIEEELKRIERETKLKEKESLAERQRINLEFNLAIKKADAEFQKRELELSKKYYNQALYLKPKEVYPKEQIVKIDLHLVDQEEKLEAQRVLDEKYTGLIQTADNQFEEKNYADSKVSYGLAIELKPNQDYPKNQIIKIQDIEAEIKLRADNEAQRLAEAKALNEKYTALISFADQAFASNQYADAKLQYGSALKLKPSEAYPLSQIRDIDQRLAEEKRLAEESERIMAEQKALELKYNKLIKDGDNLFKRKDYLAAKTSFQSALDLKSEELYPQSQIQAIDGILADNKQLAEEKARKKAELKAQDEKYATLLTSADQSFSDKIYEQAKQIYLEASVLKPEETYPKTQIAKIDRLVEEKRLSADKLAKQKALDDQYNNFISQADSQMKIKDFDQALINYQRGLELKPKEVYPKQQLKKLKLAIAENAKQVLAQKSINDKYERFILMGDEKLADQTYDAARFNYNKALELKPNETYPKTQLRTIEALIAEEVRLNSEQKAFEEKYKQYISSGDSDLKAGEYTLAKQNYSDALAMKPNESYPKSQLQKITNLMAQQSKILADKKAFEDKVSNLIALADSQMNTEEYEKAISNYQQALSLKPKEIYAKEQLKKAKQGLLDRKRQEEEKIKLELQQKILFKKYDVLIAKADKNLAAKKYFDSRDNYTDALAIKPTAKYPKDQLNKLEELMAKELQLTTAMKEFDAKYDAYITTGDSELKSGEYVLAKQSYLSASEMKPDEVYPKDQLQKLTGLIEEQARMIADKKMLDENYSNLINQADAELKSEDYVNAGNTYQQASNLKPKESYPKEQLKKVKLALSEQKRLADEKAKQERATLLLEEKYNEAISLADAGFNSGDFKEAALNYNVALNLKYGDAYATSQLKKIEELIFEQESKALEASLLAKKKEELEKRFRSFINKGDKLFKDRKLVKSLENYELALQIKGNDEYSLAQVDRIKKQLELDKLASEKRLAVSEGYKNYITKADELYSNKELKLAKEQYLLALDIKPKEAYPKTQIARINVALEKQARLERKNKRVEQEFEEAIKIADSHFKKESYSMARHHYKSALKIKPDDVYSKSQLSEISLILRANASANEDDLLVQNSNSFDEILLRKKEAEYEGFISKADKAFNSKYLGMAKAYYRMALKLFERDYPQERLIEIEKMKMAFKSDQVHEEYERLMSSGDKQLEKSNYTIARHYYNKAMSLATDKNQVLDKLDLIKKGIADDKHKVLDAEFDTLTKKGDDAFNAGNLPIAKFYYLKALKIKPEDSQLRESLENIKKTLK